MKHEKSNGSKRKTCVAKSLHESRTPIASFFETYWAIGTSVVAAMASPLLIH